MIILVLNSGSSSVKYQLFDMNGERVLASGNVERIGMEDAIVTYRPEGKDKIVEVMEILEHYSAVEIILEKLVDKAHGVLSDIRDVQAVGHRIVHGGEFFSQSVIVTEDVKQKLRDLISLAPLHSVPNVKGIEAAEHALPEVPHVVVFDTAFHQTMPPHAYMYPVPRILYKKHKVRRYGFHGTSHHYVSNLAAQTLGQPYEQLKIITCHIGNGASVTAVENGKSVDTSMGLTPLEGLMMGTRCGDIDPAAVTFIMAQEDLTLGDVNSMMNKHSGLLGISGVSSDMRDIEKAMSEGDANAKLAHDMYVYRVQKYIGAFTAAMNGVDAIVFTAGVGENSSLLRQRVCEKLTYLGLSLDEAKNEVRSDEPRTISSDDSRVQVLVVPTNEELMIARETKTTVATTNA
ncbi:acetate/propionate family kinase [Numidum massiliense]|uniref:acetate/propionate family kinase n=1 Tax=Numidum massiliense TaxID=1522315 RepID=UPI0006D56012|nr:acetate kinase [Numidum massiliense]